MEIDEIGGRILPKDCSDTYHANFSQGHITNLLRTLQIATARTQDIEDKEQILYRKGGPLKKLSGFYGAEVYNFLQTVTNFIIHVTD